MYTYVVCDIGLHDVLYVCTHAIFYCVCVYIDIAGIVMDGTDIGWVVPTLRLLTMRVFRWYNCRATNVTSNHLVVHTRLQLVREEDLAWWVYQVHRFFHWQVEVRKSPSSPGPSTAASVSNHRDINSSASAADPAIDAADGLAPHTSHNLPDTIIPKS